MHGGRIRRCLILGRGSAYDPQRKEMRCFYIQYSPGSKRCCLISMVIPDGKGFDVATGIVQSDEFAFRKETAFDLKLVQNSNPRKQTGTGTIPLVE